MRRALLLIGLLAMTWSSSAHAQSEVLTRAQASRLLLLNRTDSIPLFPNNGRFADIKPKTPDARYILAAEHYGILTADDHGYLHPEGAVDRATFLKMIAMTFGLQQHLPHAFSDVQDSDWFAPFAGVAHQYGFFETDGALRPTVLMNAYEAIYAIALVQNSVIHPNDLEEGAISKMQADDKLNIYVVISTKQLHTLFVDSSTVATQSDRQPSVGLDQLRQQVLDLVNAERAKVHAAPLIFNRFLIGSAQTYAEDMNKLGFFSHVSPTGQTLKDRMQLSGYEDRKYAQSCHCIPGYNLGENLARGQKTAQEVVDAWMQSKAHREAILNPSYKETGIGIEGEYWVQHFGAVVMPEIENGA